jgi:hypothetical protein
VKRFAILILMIFSGLSCEKNKEEVLNHIYNATLKVNVYNQQVTIGGQLNNIPVKDATIELFETKYDRDNNQNMIVSHYTDSAGLAQFYNLLLDYYYIRASHPAYGQVLDETSTPDGSVSFVDVIF